METCRAIRHVDRNVFLYELRGPAWAAGSYSVSQSAGGIYHYIICKTLQLTERIAL